jgi:phosphoribosylglycinamide formyltransferase-1
MYGHHVHKAVKANGERVTGITIHYVNEAYDEGAIIFQEEVQLTDEDRVEDIAKKVHTLEHRHFPSVIDQLLKKESNEV